MSTGARASSVSDTFEQPGAVTGHSEVAIVKESCLHSQSLGSSFLISVGNFLERLPPELRLEIYKLVLPVETCFSQEWHLITVEIALLSTCRLIKNEAYPLFLFSNNFKIGIIIPYPKTLYPQTHAFFKHVREVTFDWYPKLLWNTGNHSTGRVSGSQNVNTVRELYKYPKLQILHIIGHWHILDDNYMRLVHHYREEGALHVYLEYSGLEALLGIPGISEITFRHFTDGRRTKHLIAMGEYMTKCLADLKTAPYDPTPPKRQVLSCIKEAFRDKYGRESSSEDET
ncbi:uncharacterized protein BP5553_04656 [Venustampulla echinocandica]|uniref:F-box domain-containing protein n=1 Tax=Venustampulla echinocandica TaxID=2656787 RepID=A0A370TNX9_9HELO|nr:uncharacterized protein BP5553_04656 [Venustampulla echinocandica]RDL37223.1 hypothetical protein BP5553_04656 [Venustampulla echinocandica]